jgi:TP901 family phage tail tape measure protein
MAQSAILELVLRLKDQASSGLESAATRTEALGKSVDGASQILGSLALPLAAAGAGAIKMASDFDSSLRNINSIAGLSEDQLGKLGDQFVSLSLDSSKTFESANALATGFYDIQSAGFAGADGMKVLEASTKAASAGMSTTQTAANAISATLNAYGESADQAAHVSDVLFQTVNLGVVNFEELSSSIGRVIPSAASAKVSIEEVGAAVSTMTKSGLAGAQAVTDLNSLDLQRHQARTRRIRRSQGHGA